jgi:protein AFG1
MFLLTDRGDVGCGKTMLMDMLYDTLPATTNKTRVHFHAFMLDIHKYTQKFQVQSPDHT